ncbi:MAG: alpha/beta hydrolase [Anaerolineae bacterium]|nr:alpha/beta hydrolase [Anaerolineae bacterium]
MTTDLSSWTERHGYTSTFFSLPNLCMFAATAGPEDGPLVILLHGFPECAYSWRHQIGPLAQAGFRVVAPDQRGYGMTDKQGPYDLDTLVDDIVQLIQANGHTKAYIAGHDWGAAVAWHLVDTHPDRVHRLAILNVPHPQVIERAILSGNWRQALKSWYILFFQLPWLPERLLSLNDFRPLRDTLRQSSRPGTFSEADLEEYAHAWRQPGAMSAMLGWYRAQVRRVARRQYRPRPVAHIQTPTLILWGDQDTALEPSLADLSARRLTRGQVVHFPAASHFVHEDEPADVARRLIQHFRSQVGSHYQR